MDGALLIIRVWRGVYFVMRATKTPYLSLLHRRCLQRGKTEDIQQGVQLACLSHHPPFPLSQTPGSDTIRDSFLVT